ncbi:MAG: ABC transporter permease subunit, partial [Pseudomonadota bacterium]
MSAQAAWMARTWRTADLAGRWGFGLLIAMALFAFFGPLVSRFDPAAIDLAGRLTGPSVTHWFGTDELGRDLFARVASGARLSLLAAVSVVFITIAFGILIGGLAGLIGGFFETVIMRAVDIMLSIPALVLAIALAAALGPSLINALTALIVVRLPVFIRLARAQTLSIKSRAFVDAARMAGAGPFYQLRHHILPNLMGIMLVQGLMDMAGVVLAAAA